MSDNKVYEISAHFTETMDMMALKAEALCRAIAQLARQRQEAVWFHSYKEVMFGAPAILLECSDDFMSQVKTLPGYAASRGLGERHEPKTERNALLQQQYFGALPNSATNKPNFSP